MNLQVVMSRSSEIHNFDGEYFYKSYDVLSEFDRENLIKESEEYLTTHRKITEPYPPIMAENFFTKEILKKECWKNLTKNIVTNTNNYSEKYLNINLKFESCWINKIDGYTEKNIKDTLYFDNDLKCYTDNHYHAHHKDQIISCIFYLQNISAKYGTLVRTKNGSLVINGEENSLTIFDPRLYHTALIPEKELCAKKPRYVIIMSFIKK